MIDTCFELESLRLVLSDYFYPHEKAPGRLVPYIYERLDVDDVLDVAFASVHAKIATIETTDGLKVVMEGSANLRSSRNIEQFRVECDADLFGVAHGRRRKAHVAGQGLPRMRPDEVSLPRLCLASGGKPALGGAVASPVRVVIGGLDVPGASPLVPIDAHRRHRPGRSGAGSSPC